MKTDRELLELAAKAAGICYNPTARNKYGLVCAREHDQGDKFIWNPLTDDGAALRLAAQLGMDLYLHGDSALAGDIYNDEWDSYEIYGVDKMVAVRRAIVVAAAERAK